MKRILYSIILGAALMSNTGCKYQLQSESTKNPVGTKVGVAQRNVWFGLAFGHTDISLQAAAKKGNITKIGTYSTGIKYGLFVTRYKTIVSGE